MDYFRGRLHSLRSHSHSTAENENGPVNAPKHADIASLAYSYWEAGGRRENSDLSDWLQAERVLTDK